MTEDYLKNRQIDSIRGSAHFLNRVSRIAHENKRIVFLLLASWPTILLSSPQRTRIPPHPSLMSKMSTIPSIPSIHPLLNRKPNSYLLVCEKRKREEEETEKVFLVKQQLAEVAILQPYECRMSATWWRRERSWSRTFETERSLIRWSRQDRDAALQ